MSRVVRGWNWLTGALGPQRYEPWDGEIWPPPLSASPGDVFTALHKRIERLEERLNK